MEWMEKAKDMLGLLNLTLSPEQGGVFWNPGRVRIVAGGEGSGKSFLGALSSIIRTSAEQANQGFEGTQYGWIIGADFEDANEEIKQARDFAITLGIYDRVRSSFPTAQDSQKILALKTGVIMKTVSAYDPTKLGREEPDFIVGCEVSRWETEAWLRAYGRLARKFPRAWGIFTGSFETSVGWFPEVWKQGQGANELDIVSFSLPSWSNPVRYPGGRADPAIIQQEKVSTPERFMERFGGRPAPPRDAVLPEFRPTLHVAPDLELDTKQPVYLFIDPGTHVYAVLFVQLINGEARVIDEVYAHGWTHAQVTSACMNKEAWKYVREGVMDVAGRQNHSGLGTPQAAWFNETGLTIRSQYCKVEQTVERLRSILSVNPISGKPYLRIHPRCRGIISEMGGTASPVEGGGIWRMKGGFPDNHNDHSCKALGYGLIAHLGTNKPYDNDVAWPFGDDQVGSPDTYLVKVTRDAIR